MAVLRQWPPVAVVCRPATLQELTRWSSSPKPLRAGRGGFSADGWLAGTLGVGALLAALGDRGGRLREAVAGLDRVVDRGDIGYVSLVGAAV